jgi:hypothetical protein
MDRKARTIEDLLTLQDNAIEALKQALAATQLALEAVTRARNEQGTIPPMFTITQPSNLPNPYVVPNPSNPFYTGTGTGKWLDSQPKYTLGDQLPQYNGGMNVGSVHTFNAALAEQNALDAVSLSASQQSLAQKYLDEFKAAYEIPKSIEPQGALHAGQGCVE